MSEPKPDGDTSKNKPTDATRASPSPPKGFVHVVLDFIHLPPWVINNIRQRKSQHLLFRSCLASWLALILLLANPSLRTIGNLYVQANAIVCDLLYADRNDSLAVVISGYSFPCSSLQDIRYKFTLWYVSFLKCPTTSFINRAGVQLVLQSLLGLLTGWAIGSAAMKASISVRSQTVDQATLQQAVNKSAIHDLPPCFFWSDPQHSFQGSVNPEQLYKVEVFRGVFLDAGLVDDSTSELYSLNFFPSVPQLYLVFSWDSVP